MGKTLCTLLVGAMLYASKIAEEPKKPVYIPAISSASSIRSPVANLSLVLNSAGGGYAMPVFYSLGKEIIGVCYGENCIDFERK